MNKKSAPALCAELISMNDQQRRTVQINPPHTSEKGEPAAMAAHHLKHERAAVRGGGRIDVVNRFAYSVQRGGRANSHVRHGHVVVDRPHQPDYFQVAVAVRLLSCDFA
jgi:hypothetical protein